MKTPYDNTTSVPDPDNVPAPAAGHGGAQRPMASACQDSPRTVIRGESCTGGSSNLPPSNSGDFQPDESAHPFAAHTDWLNCTIPTRNDPDFLSTFIHNFFSLGGEQFAPMVEIGKGLHGWHRSFDLGKTGAKLAIGGQNGTCYLSLPGKACTLIALDTWPELVLLLDTHHSARITRWDGAVDDYKGLHSVDWAVEQYLTNQFNAGGNKPRCKQHGNWLEPDGSGRTFYVGKRKNGKLIRIYEKGMQLGDPTSTWVRWELELHNKRREIPWDVLIRPGQYVAGAYPCTSWISSEASRISTIQKTAKIGYDTLNHYARIAYGPLINVMMEQEGSAEKVVELLIRGGKPARLELPIPPELTGHILPRRDE